MGNLTSADIPELYSLFEAPITTLDCGKKCAPYNERGVPFCCDTRHTVPSAYREEWQYLQVNTDLWHAWQGSTSQETEHLRQQAPDHQVLIECLGHKLCQRGYRSLTCRSFPFFPYITRQGEFAGLSYYWEYEDRCWVISNLQAVSAEYRRQFIDGYDLLFEQMPEEMENFRRFSSTMRRVFSHRRQAIPLLHVNGFTYKVSPGSGRMRRVAPQELPKFGPYAIANLLPFPDEIQPSVITP
jgi:hypothetical protein